MSTQYFNPRLVAGPFRLEHLDAAYRHAKLTPPNIADATHRLLHDEPTVEQVREQFARAAIQDGDAKKQFTDYVKQMQRAQAVEQLSINFQTVTEALAAETLPERIDQCITAIRPAFNRTVKALADAATKLHRERPLDRETAFDLDLTAEWKQATTLLAELGGYVTQTARIEHGEVDPVGWTAPRVS